MSATSNTNENVNYRHFNVQSDFDSLVTLLQYIEQNDHDGEDVSEETLREQLTWFGHDPSLDRWIATTSSGTELIGYGTIFKTPNDEHADLYLAVHPAWRQQGIATRILIHLLERLYEVDAKDIRVYANADNQAASVFLRAHHFTPRSTYTRMTISTNQAFPLPTFPPGFVLNNYAQIQRTDLLLQAFNQCYEGLWGHRHITEEEMNTWLPTLTPEGIFLLFTPGGAVAGISRAENSQHLTELRGVPTGLIDAPGVVPAYRHANLYLPLLLTSLQWLSTQKHASIELESWGDTPETLALYQQLGFTLVQEQISYQRDLN
jgi:mycothiol synthase